MEVETRAALLGQVGPVKHVLLDALGESSVHNGSRYVACRWGLERKAVMASTTQ